MRMVSILGDSISTYEGYNPPGYAVFYDRAMQVRNGLNSVYDTWWAKVNQRLRAYLCVNNSYSGSRVTGDGFPAASSLRRLQMLRTAEYVPELILIYIGINDFAAGVKIKEASQFRQDMSAFEPAYDAMLAELRQRYPMAKILCGTLMKSEIRDNSFWTFPEQFAGVHLEEYNRVIRSSARENGCLVADLAAQELRYETLDGSHPTAQGHLTMAYAWFRCLAALGLID